MTLIATVIGKYGIVQASDSDLADKSGAVDTGKKVVRLGFMDGAVACAGASSVDGRSMDTWMPACIETYAANPQPTLGGFAQHLAGRLGQEMREAEWQEGGMIQIGGYASEPPGVHPEAWFVHNLTGLSPDEDEYDGIDRQWHVSENFWARDYRRISTRLALASGFYFPYFSGITPERTAFGGVSQLLQEFFQQVWQHDRWGFRAPRTLDELAAMVELSIRAIGTLYRASHYPGGRVGESVQVEKLRPPPNAVEL